MGLGLGWARVRARVKVKVRVGASREAHLGEAFELLGRLPRGGREAEVELRRLGGCAVAGVG